MDCNKFSQTKNDTMINAIDKITQYQQGKGLTAAKTVRKSEDFFQDHFPDDAVYPGVMMLEGMAQSAAWYLLKEAVFNKSQAYVSEVTQVKYSKLVRPETTLQFEVEYAGRKEGRYEFKGRVIEDNKAVATARFTMQMGQVGDVSPIHGRLEPLICQSHKRQFEALKGK